MSTTPEPRDPSELQCPPAPRFGPMYDDFEVYAPRKSARVAERSQRDDNTPPPPQRPTTKKKSKVTANTTPMAPKFTFDTKSDIKMIDLMSPPTTGRTSRSKTIGSFEEALAGSRIDYGEGRSKDDTDDSIITGTISASHTTIFPTPARTPSSSKTTIESSAVKSVSRNIFNRYGRSTVEEAMPTPRKRGRKNAGGFRITSDVEEETSPIKIFTDSKERIPEVDNDPDNPFINHKPTKATGSESTREVKHHKTRHAKKTEAQHSFGPENMGSGGHVFQFRGKKIWRPQRPEVEDDEDEEDAEYRSAKPAAPVAKWLFGTHPLAGKEKVEEEEEATDIDDELPHKAPSKAMPAKVSTKAAVKTASAKFVDPVTPTSPVTPTTTRETRSTKETRGRGQDQEETRGRGQVRDEIRGRGQVREESLSGGRGRANDRSPFNKWNRYRSPMVGDDGSPTRKPRGNRGRVTRSAASRGCL